MFLRSFRFRPNDIDAALAERQFRVAFQPQMRLADSTLAGAEAFVRWRHPEFGMIPPGLFLDFLVEQGRMTDLTRLVLEDSLAALSAWQEAGLDCGVSVNLSIADLRAPGLCASVAEALERHAIAAPLLTLELPHTLTYLGPNRRIETRPRNNTPERRTDTATSRAWSDIQGAVAGLRALGVRIALDGHRDALETLEMFAPQTFDTVKIGATAIRQLVEGVVGGAEGPLSRTRLRFAAEQGVETVAMGVEDAGTLETVTGIGFSAAQGLLIGHPGPAGALAEWSPPGHRGEGDARPRHPAETAAARAPAAPHLPGRRAFGQRQRPLH
ncbi:MAG: EAL domain-containing protein [Alphaproteobacteria bacterium]|nr:EAL domain-containing protein [Alphaproteobacteria bacterium]MDX5369404.1 EAL domain-containing protein [Alphaproteobacteria bacterium]MDX5464087.1 EAL domain-containing protein [Alphaproteobacteria bacterium]